MIGIAVPAFAPVAYMVGKQTTSVAPPRRQLLGARYQSHTFTRARARLG
jgi:hypothetical protein